MTIKRMFLGFMLSMVARVQQPNIVWIRQNLRYNKIRQTHHYQAIKVRQVRIHHQCIPHTSHVPIVIFSHIHLLSPTRSKIPHIFIFPMSTHHHRLVSYRPSLGGLFAFCTPVCIHFCIY